jgi:hypothetical protein
MPAGAGTVQSSTIDALSIIKGTWKMPCPTSPWSRTGHIQITSIIAQHLFNVAKAPNGALLKKVSTKILTLSLSQTSILGGKT